MTEVLNPTELGRSPVRIDGPAKVRGVAPYAYEHPVEAPLYLHPLQSTVGRGVIRSFDTAAAEALAGVVAIVTHENATRLADASDGELSILQDAGVHFRGQLIGAVLAETPETARQAADLVRVDYDQQPHDALLAADRDDLYKPDVVNPSFPTDTDEGDVEAAFAAAPVSVDQTYTTAGYYNSPMEPHTVTAQWDGSTLTFYDSTQGVHAVRATMAPIFGLEPEQIRVVAANVGGGFGSKGSPHAHNTLAWLAVQHSGGRPVKFALTRQQMFSFVGYRTPTIQHVRLGAEVDGRLTAITHDVIEQTAKIKEFAEQTAVSTRKMYAAPNRRTSHRLAALDVAVPFWMRAPGEAPGMFATEVAMDELAVALGMDPVELRIRNEPEVDPETGAPWSSRNVVACYREGARRFGWESRDPEPGIRRAGEWLVGTGMAASTYPVNRMPGSQARISLGANGCYSVEIGSVDIGTGAGTVLTQIAADALDVPFADIELSIGSTDLPFATVAGGSAGTTSWGSAIVGAARAFRTEFGAQPPAGAQTQSEQTENPDVPSMAMHAFGAHFAEVGVHADTGEVRVRRMLGVFAAGRILNPKLARSQFLGGMTMGLGMALLEEGVLDHRFGHVVNHDFAEYHIAASADVTDLEAVWLEEDDPHVNPMGSKGIGEIGIVGSAAALANATFHATGIRVRDLPLTTDKFLPVA